MTNNEYIEISKKSFAKGKAFFLNPKTLYRYSYSEGFLFIIENNTVSIL
ncbi:MAG: hypothetical protein ACOCRO_09985 [Halanaerobiales bacterium]